MIDTIGIQYPISIDNNFLSPPWGYERKPTKRGFFSRYMLVVPAQNDCPVTYRFIPYTPKGPLLQVEFSLPHLVFGDNVFMVWDIEGAINQANQWLPNVPGIPMVDLWGGLLYRLDICWNFQVGRLVPFYIQALQQLEFCRRKTKPYSSQGVQFLNNQVSLKFYNKEQWYIDKKQPINPSARGVLRLEVTLRKAAIKKRNDGKSLTLRDMSKDLALGVLEYELERLGMLNRSIGTYDTTLTKLCETYGTDAGFCYFGALAAKVE